MKKLICLYFLFVFLFGIYGCFPKSIKPNNILSEYKNKELNISLKYPSDWKPDNSIPKLGSMPSRYFSEEGFFALNVTMKNSLDLEAVAIREANSGDYGKNPTVERKIHNARIGYLIIPSSDQPISEKLRSCFVAEMRTVYRSNRINFDVILLFSDKEHINSILDSMEIY